MRCPHCAGEIPPGSRFCGICGRNITPSPEPPAYGRELETDRPAFAQAAGAEPGGSMSLFELPVSRSARTLKLALVLALDAILAAAGIVMILSYLDARRDPAVERPSRAPAGPEAPDQGTNEVEEHAPASGDFANGPPGR
jgi:hypothetical protein